MDPARDPRSDRRSSLTSKRRGRQPAVFTRLRRWLRPPRRLRPTGAGWSFFAFTFGVGFAALNTGNNLLYLVLALMLAFLVLSGVLSESALRGIEVRRRLPAELFAGRPARVALEIHNAQRRAAAFAVVVEDRAADADLGDCATGRCVALRIAPGACEVRSYAFTPERRGALCFEGFVVSTRFPFGLFSKSRVLEVPDEVLVYPSVSRLAPPREDAVTSAGGDRPLPRDGAGDVADGLRDREVADPARRIHWRASARAQRLLVRRRAGDEQSEIQVQLELAEPGGEAFERRVSRAASEALAGLEAGRRVALRAGRTEFGAASGPRQRAALLAFLARVEPAGAEAAA
ncbi:MAG TPA: DUF58 domain-containing protein [Myxococcota bacterium]|nr:DUF58 domain-containing protein [Myxococcota bacterium]